LAARRCNTEQWYDTCQFGGSAVRPLYAAFEPADRTAQFGRSTDVSAVGCSDNEPMALPAPQPRVLDLHPLSLQDTLDELLQSGSTSNPALNRLLSDYSRAHTTVAVVGGCFLLALLLLGRFSWTRFRRAPQSNDRRWTFERKTYACFAVLGVAVGLLMAVVVAANLSNALDARQGLAGVVETLGVPPAGTGRDELHQAFETWLQSGDTAMPTLIESRIDDRRAWQQPKAIIVSALILLFAVAGGRTWRRLIRRSRVRADGWSTKDRARLVAAIGSVPVCVLLMIMVIGNTQGSVAPLTLTLLFG
jgi:hypothetical protein